MNRAYLLKTALMNLVLFSLIFHYLSDTAYSFTPLKKVKDSLTGFASSDEYLSHTKGSGSCTNQQCHIQFATGKRAFQHKPVIEGECEDCHNANAYPSKYGLDRDRSITCYRCHKSMEHEIQSSKFIHSPIKNGDCTSCHDPHGSDTEFILKKPYNELCSLCHNLKGLYAGKFIHKPVKDGNCGLCHDPHASNFKSRLSDIGANLCITCHENMVTGMTQKYIHAPLIKSGCSDCHDPHSGGDKLRLKGMSEQICFTCHEEKKNEINQYAVKHKPAFEGQCIACHSPHYSETKYLLIDKVDTICYSCHKGNRVWKKRYFQHGPVVQGNCTACHNPHGSDNAFILRLSFPHKFYSSYKKGKYNLCFLCHKEALVTTERTANVTNFRNGEINLHMLHVNQEKGRTCRACHDVHASDQEDHIREEFRFGSVDIPIYYFKTDTGGKCIPGCHVERMYDRVEEVKNN